MAVSLTPVSVAPYSIKYLWVYDGVGGVGSAQAVRTKAQILADLATTGQRNLLAEFLNATTADADWDLLDRSNRFSVYQQLILMPAGTSFIAEMAIVVPDGQALLVDGFDGNAGQAIVELRFHHTYDR